MISRYEAYMDGVAMSSLSPNLLILDISHGTSKISRDTVTLVRRDGSIMVDKTLSAAQVKISFQLREYSIAERQKVCQEVARWAQGAILETNDRPGQRLHVQCDSFPVIGSALKWLDDLSVTFTAYNYAHWEEKTAVSTTLTGTSGTSTLFVPGNAGKALVEATITPSSGTVNDITLTVGDTSIALVGCGATSSQPVTISYDYIGLLRIKRGTTSVMDKRTAASSDDLLAVCGAVNTFGLTASGAVSAAFSVRGCWL